MIRKTAIFIFFLILSGCQLNNVKNVYPDLVVDSNAKRYLNIVSLQNSNDAGLLRAGVRLTNKNNSVEILRYRFVWFDKSGFELQGISSIWEEILLRPSEPVSISRIAASEKAVSYKVYLFDIHSVNISSDKGQRK